MRVSGLGRKISDRQLAQLSTEARRAVSAKDWATVRACSREILQQDKKSSEGWFLSGLLEKAAARQNPAASAFAKALRFDARRHDAAIELAHQYLQSMRHRDALDLLGKYESRLSNSPLYLDLAAKIYSRLGLHARALPLYAKASQLQPGADSLQASLAASSVLVGKIDQAKTLYQDLLERHPGHQRNHYELSRLDRARDRSHIEQMLDVLNTTRMSPAQNIFFVLCPGQGV